jgi:hypothetical protein
MVMTGTNGIANLPATALRATWKAQPRVEKARFSNGLDGEHSGAQDHGHPTRTQLSPLRPSRNDTARDVPEWQTVRLVPTFVTQVLAQALDERSDDRSALAAYARKAGLPVALICDRNT